MESNLVQNYLNAPFPETEKYSPQHSIVVLNAQLSDFIFHKNKKTFSCNTRVSRMSNKVYLERSEARAGTFIYPIQILIRPPT